MGYMCSRQVSLTSFSWYFMLFGHHFKYEPPFDMMLWQWWIWMIFQCGFRHVNNKKLYSNVWCLWLWKIWQLPNTRIHYVMSLLVVVVINFGFRGSSKEIMFIYNKQHWLLWMWLQDLLFTCAKGSTFRSVVVGGLRWSNMERPCVQSCTMSSS
jgi:hypothetical protein